MEAHQFQFITLPTWTWADSLGHPLPQAGHRWTSIDINRHYWLATGPLPPSATVGHGWTPWDSAGHIRLDTARQLSTPTADAVRLAKKLDTSFGHSLTHYWTVQSCLNNV